MNKDSKVWIIIINYNGIYDTRECIRSILESKCNVEIVIVDNASDNNEGDKLEKEYSGAYILKNKENLGFAGGNNLGIRFAIEQGADYIMLLNNDTVIHPNMINELMKNSSTADIILPRMFYYDKKDIIWYSGGTINRFTGNIKCKYIGKNEKEIKDRAEKCTFATGCCLLFSASLIKKIGYLKDEYFMYYEDTEFSLRVIEMGGTIKVVSSAILWHKISASTGGAGSALSLYYSSRNRLYCIKDHKKYFFDTALFCTVTSRVCRIIQYKLLRNNIWKSYYKALIDYKRGIAGRQLHE